MSGCGRKHRAKHLTQQYLDDDGWSGPDASKGDRLAICLEAPQSKMVKIRLLRAPSTANAEASSVGVGVGSDAPEEVAFASLPGKFQKVVWLGSHDVVVVRDLAILQKPSPTQLKRFLVDNPQWECVLGVTASAVVDSAAAVEPMEEEENDAGDDDGADALENPNRNNIRHRRMSFNALEESDEDEEEEDEEGSDEEGNDVHSDGDVA